MFNNKIENPKKFTKEGEEFQMPSDNIFYHEINGKEYKFAMDYYNNLYVEFIKGSIPGFYCLMQDGCDGKKEYNFKKCEYATQGKRKTKNKKNIKFNPKELKKELSQSYYQLTKNEEKVLNEYAKLEKKNKKLSLEELQRMKSLEQPLDLIRERMDEIRREQQLEQQQYRNEDNPMTNEEMLEDIRILKGIKRERNFTDQEIQREIQNYQRRLNPTKKTTKKTTKKKNFDKIQIGKIFPWSKDYVEFTGNTEIDMQNLEKGIKYQERKRNKFIENSPVWEDHNKKLKLYQKNLGELQKPQNDYQEFISSSSSSSSISSFGGDKYNNSFIHNGHDYFYDDKKRLLTWIFGYPNDRLVVLTNGKKCEVIGTRRSIHGPPPGPPTA